MFGVFHQNSFFAISCQAHLHVRMLIVRLGFQSAQMRRPYRRLPGTETDTVGLNPNLTASLRILSLACRSDADDAEIQSSFFHVAAGLQPEFEHQPLDN